MMPRVQEKGQVHHFVIEETWIHEEGLLMLQYAELFNGNHWGWCSWGWCSKKYGMVQHRGGRDPYTITIKGVSCDTIPPNKTIIRFEG
jgi:hypothetical protein